MVLPELNCLHLDSCFGERLDHPRLIEADIVFITVSEDSPVSIAEGVELPLVIDDSRMSETDLQVPDI